MELVTNNRWLKFGKSDSESWNFIHNHIHLLSPVKNEGENYWFGQYTFRTTHSGIFHINQGSCETLNSGGLGSTIELVININALQRREGYLPGVIRWRKSKLRQTSKKHSTSYKNNYNTTIQTTTATLQFLKPSNKRKIKPSLTLPTITLVDYTTNP